MLEDIDPILPKPHFSFLNDIDPVVKIRKNSLDGSSELFGARLFGNDQETIYNIPRFQKLCLLKNDSGFLDCLKYRGVSKDNNIGVWGHGHV